MNPDVLDILVNAHVKLGRRDPGVIWENEALADSIADVEDALERLAKKGLVVERADGWWPCGYFDPPLPTEPEARAELQADGIDPDALGLAEGERLNTRVVAEGE